MGSYKQDNFLSIVSDFSLDVDQAPQAMGLIGVSNVIPITPKALLKRWH